MHITKSHDTYREIKNFIFSNINTFKRDAEEFGELDLTVAVDDEFTQWNYQTGDNSFTGGAYGLPHWGVTTIYPDSDPLGVYEEIITQLQDLTEQGIIGD